MDQEGLQSEKIVSILFIRETTTILSTNGESTSLNLDDSTTVINSFELEIILISLIFICLISINRRRDSF